MLVKFEQFILEDQMFELPDDNLKVAVDHDKQIAHITFKCDGSWNKYPSYLKAIQKFATGIKCSIGDTINKLIDDSDWSLKDGSKRKMTQTTNLIKIDAPLV